MKFNKAIEYYKPTKHGGVGFTIFPYKICFGVSIGFLPCNWALMFRIYFLFFKIWGHTEIWLDR